MQRRKKGIGFGIAVLSAIGLALPGTAAARSFQPAIGVQNTSMIVVVTAPASADATGTVSWGDVSWGDVLIVE
jgi:hypothetical protein